MTTSWRLLSLLFALSACLLGINVVVLRAADTISPEKVIETEGALVISDGSSKYIFCKGGRFESRPVGISGRTMRGYWERNKDGQFVVVVLLGWVNGLSGNDEYRRIVFSIYDIYRESQPKRTASQPKNPVYSTYFLIEEFVRIEKPEKEIWSLDKLPLNQNGL